MIVEPKQQPHHKDRGKRERTRGEKALDELLRTLYRHPIQFQLSSQYCPPHTRY